MATAREQNPYQNGGGEGAGFGKFPRRPFRRSQTTPYDRPPTALRNPNNRSNGWLSKIVDPAQRLIASSAHKLFSTVFRKRLPPPPPPPPPTPPSSDAAQEVRDNHQEAVALVANDSSGELHGAIVETDAQINCSDVGGLTELEKLLKLKTFTREEIDHLTALMHSRTVDSAVREGKRTEVVPSDPVLPRDQMNEYPKTPALETGIQNHVSNPYVTSSAPIEDVSSPAELAKAYMGSRPSKVSPSMLCLRSPPREDHTLLKSQHFTSRSPVMSIAPRATSLARVHDNGFLTPRSRGRSAIYSMARTPYARVYSASTQGVGVSEPSSSAQHAPDHNVLFGSKQGALKRRSSVLDNDIGSVGPNRRIRHKSNLLSSKGLALPHSGSPLSIVRSGAGVDAAQRPTSSMQKAVLLGEVKHSNMKLSAEYINDSKPSTSFPPLPSRSSDMASKILQQLDKLVSPREKSSELRQPTVNDKSPLKLSSSMLRGQALRSMETIDSSKLLDSIQENDSTCTLGNSSASAEKLKPMIDKVENGPLKPVVPNRSGPVVTDADATVSRKQVISIAKSGDSSLTKPVSYGQKTRAFHMSAHEDCFELDDDAHPNGAVSSFPSSVKEISSSTSMADKITSSTETIVQKPQGSSVVMPSNSFPVDDKPHVGTVDGEKVDVAGSRTSSVPDHTFKPVTVDITASPQTVLGSEMSTSPNGSVANTPSFNFGNKVVPSTELTAANSPSKESTKSGPIFGLDKVVSSKETGTDAPFVYSGINKNADSVPQVPFTFSSSGDGGFNGVKFGASPDSKLRNSVSSTTVAGAVDSIPKVLHSDNADTRTKTVTGFSNPSSEPALSNAASTALSTSLTNIATFGSSSNQNGLAASSPSISSPFPSMFINNSTSQNLFSSSSLAASYSSSASVSSTSASMTTSAITESSNSSSFTPVVASSSSTPSFFKFGSAPLPSTGLPVSSTSGSEPVETKKDAGISILGSTSSGSSSAAVGSTGSGVFGLTSSAMSSANIQSQGSVFGATSGSVLGAMAPPATSGFASSTQSQSVAVGSSASPPLFGLTGNSAFSSESSSFPSSNPTSNIFNAGTTFGQSIVASSSEANLASSNSGTGSSLVGQSSWQPSKSPFGSSFSSSSSSSSGFSFGASTPSVTSSSSPLMFGSTTSASSPTPQFSFTSAAATSNMQPAFGNPSPVFAFGSASVNNNQMSAEDSMAEDTFQPTPPVTPVFGQQPAPVFGQQPQSHFVFGAPTSTPTGASSFQFGNQQSIAPPNPSPFQASGSLEFNSGGSFSLGPGGGDKSGRKIVRLNKNKLRKK